MADTYESLEREYRNYRALVSVNPRLRDLCDRMLALIKTQVVDPDPEC